MMNFWNMAARQSDGESGGVADAPAPVADANQQVPETEALGNAEVVEEPATESPASKPPQGLLDRIGQLTRQKRELEERLAQVAYAQQPQEDAPQGIDPRSVQLEIHRQAQQLAQQQAWKDTTDKVWNDGLSKYGDWATQLNNMATILGGIPTSLTEAAIESGAPQEVLYHLAKNPDEAARIALLPVARQAVAVAKVAQGLATPRRVSSAPPPITPKVGNMGSAPVSLDDPNISMEEWARLRNEQVVARRKGR
jgi:hypothetical protein